MSHWAVLGMVLALFFGCHPKEPPLSEKAAAKVKEVRETIARWSASLTGPVAHRDIDEINAILKDRFDAADQEAGLPLRRVGVTDNLGSVLAEYPMMQQVTGLDFSKYDSVVKALQNQKIGQERLFFENGPEIFLICAPLLDQGNVAGTVWLSLEAEKVKKIWEISTEAFLGINFNQ
jgi:hypothetical protein